MSLKRARDVARFLHVKIVEDPDLPTAGMWSHGRTIRIRPKADVYTILHEVGHVICGYACCREHCEYMAHGAALALARVFDIRLSQTMRHRADGYAGSSTRKACAAIRHRKTLPKEQKKRIDMVDITDQILGLKPRLRARLDALRKAGGTSPWMEAPKQHRQLRDLGIVVEGRIGTKHFAVLADLVREEEGREEEEEKDG